MCTLVQGTESWKPGGADLGAVAVLTGQASQEELRYLKSVSMQLWLFGYELTGALHGLFFGGASAVGQVGYIVMVTPASHCKAVQASVKTSACSSTLPTTSLRVYVVEDCFDVFLFVHYAEFLSFWPQRQCSSSQRKRFTS